MGAGGADGAIDASNLMKPALARGELHAIGATTLDEYRTRIEKDPALERRFAPVYIEEPAVEDTIAILRGIKARYEAHHKVEITDEASSPRPTFRPLHHRTPSSRQGHRPHRRGREQARHRCPGDAGRHSRTPQPSRRAGPRSGRCRRRRRTTKRPPESSRRCSSIQEEYGRRSARVGGRAPHRPARHRPRTSPGSSAR